MTLSKEGEDHAALPLAGRSGRASPEPPEGREAAGRFQDPGQGRAAAARGRGSALLRSAGSARRRRSSRRLFGWGFSGGVWACVLFACRL